MQYVVDKYDKEHKLSVTDEGGGASVTTGPNTNAGVGLFAGHTLYGSLAVAGSVLGMLMVV